MVHEIFYPLSVIYILEALVMSNKSKWQTIKSLWKVIVGLSVILSIITAFLQLSGAVNLWSLLVLPLYDFLVADIPIYYAIFSIVVFVIILFSAIKLRNRNKKCFLDFVDGRKLAILCQTPRTTDFLRQQYDYWESQSTWTVIGGYNFDDFIKGLEKEGFLVYENGNWHVTTKALEYIKKYHGR